MIQHRISQLKSVALRVGTLQALFVAATVAAGIGYIWQVNQAATAGFTLRELTSAVDDLTTEKERLDLQVARLQSIDSVTTRVQMLGMREVKRIEYVTPGTGAVAINR